MTELPVPLGRLRFAALRAGPADAAAPLPLSRNDELMLLKRRLVLLPAVAGDCRVVGLARWRDGRHRSCATGSVWIRLALVSPRSWPSST